MREFLQKLRNTIKPEISSPQAWLERDIEKQIIGKDEDSYILYDRSKNKAFVFSVSKIMPVDILKNIEQYEVYKYIGFGVILEKQEQELITQQFILQTH